MNYLIESEHLLLRNFRIDDVEDFYQMTRDKLIQKYLPYVYVNTIQETIQNIKFYMQGDFINNFYIVIEEKQSSCIVGSLIVNRTFKNQYEVSYMISKDFRKRGYMLEALTSFISSIPTNIVLNFYIETDNITSIKTVSKIRGMKEAPFKIKSEKSFRLFYYKKI